jgi:hypothetical protein
VSDECIFDDGLESIALNFAEGARQSELKA